MSTQKKAQTESAYQNLLDVATNKLNALDTQFDK